MEIHFFFVNPDLFYVKDKVGHFLDNYFEYFLIFTKMNWIHSLDIVSL